MPREFYLIHVAVGILINGKGEVLIAERPSHKPYPGLWEFPGSKVELDENVFQALQREFHEEIGIKIISAEPWFQIQHTYPDRKVLLDNWLIKEFIGCPDGIEGQVIRWVLPKELPHYTFPEGNKEIIDRLMG